MSEHTKEPWAIELKNVEFADTGDYDGLIQIKAHGDKKPIIEIWNGDDLAEANARRIVASVNACAGIDTAYLESQDNLATYARRMAIQSNELLAALKGLVGAKDMAGVLGELDDILYSILDEENYKKVQREIGRAIQETSAVIAKVESEK